MNKTLLSAILSTAIFCTANAQTNPTKQNTFTWGSTTNQWIDQTETEFHYYNNDDSIISQTKMYNGSTSNWENFDEQTAIYHYPAGERKLLQNTIKTWEKTISNYVNSERLQIKQGLMYINGNHYVFESGRLTEKWSVGKSGWDTSSVSASKPNVSGKVGNTTRMDMVAGNLVNRTKSQYYYSTGGALGSDWRYVWENDNWKPDEAIQYMYDFVSGLLIEQKHLSYDSVKGYFATPKYRYVISYDVDDKMEKQDIEAYDTATKTYTKNGEISYKYDDKDRLIEVLTRGYVASTMQYINYSKVTYTYESNNAVNENAISLNIYPNPVKNTLVVEVPNAVSYKVLTCLGETVFAQENEQVTSKATLELPSMASGFYFLQVRLQSGETLVKKIIKD